MLLRFSMGLGFRFSRGFMSLGVWFKLAVVCCRIRGFWALVEGTWAAARVVGALSRLCLAGCVVQGLGRGFRWP